MQRTIRVVEAYIPGIATRSPASYEQLRKDVAAALDTVGLETALLALPRDETLLVLVTWQPGQPDPAPLVAAALLGGLPHGRDATVVERAFEARLIWPRGWPARSP